MPYTSANTSRFTFSIADQPDLHNQLRVYQFELQESLNDHFYLSLDFICTDQALDYSALLSKTALLTIQGENEIQYLNGIISEACSIENGTRFARYSVKLVPMAQLLEYRKGCRIFQNLSVPEIITQVFDEAGLSDGRHYQWCTDRQYPQRDFCTQYNETEWQFISRLIAEEGIHFHYQHSADKHLLCLGDSKSALSFIDNVQHIPFKKNSGLFEAGSTEHNEHINQLTFSREIQSGKSTFRDYNFKTPSRNLEKSAQNAPAIELEDYQYPGLYSDADQAEFYAHLRQEQHNALLITAQGKSNVQRLRAGRLYTQTDHGYQTNNIDQLITAISHYGKQLQSLDEDSPTANNEGSSYYNKFTCMPASTPFRAQPAPPRPVIHGVQHAFVTGPDGEEIYTNQYGQVKVQFLWDREAQNDEKTSCWLRTSNESSGNGWGQVMTPRIGQHILIEFEQGNPDRPIISGRSYNGDHLPPYSLPDNKTRSTTKTCSSPGAGGYNEIRLEDKKSQEQIYFHSEKDLDIRCKNDRREHIKNNRSLIVENEQFEYIKSDQHQKIDQSLQYQVGSDLSQSIGQQLNVKIGSQYLQSAGNDVHIKSGQSTILDAGSEITFKASGGFIKIDASGVTINGITVNLNSGGGAGSASTASPAAPSQAVEADKNKPGQSFKVIAPQEAYKLSKFAFNNGAGGEIKHLKNRLKSSNAQYVPGNSYEITQLFFSYLKPPSPTIHEVKKNETLSEIAQQYNVLYQDIALLNDISPPYIIYPEQKILIDQNNNSESVETKLNATNIPLGEKVNIISHGTKDTTATIEIFSDDKPFKVLKDGIEVTVFEVNFDSKGESVTEVELRPKSDIEFKQLIDKFSPKINQGIITEKLTLKAEINKPGFQTSLINDDMNTIGLSLFQVYIKNAYVVDPSNGKVYAGLNVSQEGNEVLFTDAITGEPVAKTIFNNITNTLGHINDGMGGLAAGMVKIDGTFTLSNSRGFYAKHYETAWRGNQYIKTYGMTALGNKINNGSLVISLLTGAYQINSANQIDSLELMHKNSNFLDNIGQHTEQQIGSTALGIAAGFATTAIAILFLPAEAGILLTLGTFVIVGGSIGWISSWAGKKGIQEIQEIKGSTIFNDYSLHKHKELN